MLVPTGFLQRNHAWKIKGYGVIEVQSKNIVVLFLQQRVKSYKGISLLHDLYCVLSGHLCIGKASLY